MSDGDTDREAWLIHLHDEEQLACLRVLVASLRRRGFGGGGVGTARSIFLLTTSQCLRTIGDVALDLGVDGVHVTPAEEDKVTKFGMEIIALAHAFSLTWFRRIALISSTSMVLENCDDIFSTDLCVGDCGKMKLAWGEKTLWKGVVLLEPNVDVFLQLSNKLDTLNTTENGGTDHGKLKEAIGKVSAGRLDPSLTFRMNLQPYSNFSSAEVLDELNEIGYHPPRLLHFGKMPQTLSKREISLLPTFQQEDLKRWEEVHISVYNPKEKPNIAFTLPNVRKANEPIALIGLGHTNTAGPNQCANSGFDNVFFNLTEQEVSAMDPNHRLLLHLTHEALDDAAVNLKLVKFGIFATTGENHIEDQDATAKTIAHWVNSISGNSVTACMDMEDELELNAVGYAMQSLRSGECDVAIVAGSGSEVETNISTDGYGKYGWVFILKRLSSAIQDRDRIHLGFCGFGRSSSNSEAGNSMQRALQNGNLEEEMISKPFSSSTGGGMEIIKMISALENSHAVEFLKQEFRGIETHLIIASKKLLSLSSTTQTTACNIPILPNIKLLLISGNCKEDVGKLTASYAKSLEEGIHVDNFVYTAALGRTHWQFRAAVAGNTEKIKLRLKNNLDVREVPKKLPKLCFLFSGHGGHYLGLGKQLYDTCPVFRYNFDLLEEFGKANDMPKISSILWEEVEEKWHSAYEMYGCLVVQICLFKTWESWGINPSMVLGHSVGEIPAMGVAGVLTTGDISNLLKYIVQTWPKKLPPGRTLVVMATLVETEELIQEFFNRRKLQKKDGSEVWLEISGQNTRKQIMVSGDPQGAKEFIAFCSGKKVLSLDLGVSNTFHSRGVDPVVPDLKINAAEIKYKKPTCTYISAATGERKDSFDATYIPFQIRTTVKFKNATQSAINCGGRVFLELGGTSVISAMVLKNVQDFDMNLSKEIECLSSLRSQTGDWQVMLDSLGRLYEIGYPVNWDAFYKSYNCQKISIPHYPLQNRIPFILPSDKNPGDRSTSLKCPMKSQIGRSNGILGEELPALTPSTRIFHTMLNSKTLNSSMLLEMAFLAGSKFLGDESTTKWILENTSLALQNLKFNFPNSFTSSDKLAVQIVSKLTEEKISIEICTDAQNGGENNWSMALTADFEHLGITSDKKLIGVNKTEVKDSVISQVSLPPLVLRPSQPFKFQEGGLKHGQANGDIDMELVITIDETEGSNSTNQSNLQFCDDRLIQLLLQVLHYGEESSLDTDASTISFSSLDSFSWMRTPSVVDSPLRIQRQMGGNVSLWSSKGELLLCVRGAKVQAHLIKDAVQVGTFSQDWVQVENISSDGGDSPSIPPSVCLLFMNQGYLSTSLANSLEKGGHQVVKVYPGSGGPSTNANAAYVRHDSKQEMKELFEKYSPEVIFYLWGLDGTLTSLEMAGAYLHLLQCAYSSATMRRKSGVKNMNGPKLLQILHQTKSSERYPAASSLEGMSRVLRSEFPHVECKTIYLDKNEKVAQQVGTLLQEFNEGENSSSSMSTTPIVKYVKGVRYIEKLRKELQQPLTKPGNKTPERFQLILTEEEDTAKDETSKLQFRCVREFKPKLSRGEIEVEVQAMRVSLKGKTALVTKFSGAISRTCSSERFLVGQSVLVVAKEGTNACYNVGSHVVLKQDENNISLLEDNETFITAIYGKEGRTQWETPEGSSGNSLVHGAVGVRIYENNGSRNELLVRFSRELFSSRVSYLITGGLGGLGLPLVDFMWENGARHFILCGRSRPRKEWDEQRRKLEKKCDGLEITTVELDVGDQEACEQFFQQTFAKPLGGVMHLAGALEDGTISNQSLNSLEVAFRGKVDGSWNLHQSTWEMDSLEYFVLFSSASSVVGNPGQGNYAAANAFMDGLAHHRRALGLPALSVNFGLINGDGGMGENVKPKPGMTSMEPRVAFESLKRLLEGRGDLAQAMIVPEDDVAVWPEFLPWMGNYLSNVVAVGGRKALLEQIANSPLMKELDSTASMEEKETIVLKYLFQALRQVLKMDETEEIDSDEDLRNIGVDSLMLIQIKGQVETMLGGDKSGVSIGINDLMECHTSRQLSSRVVTLIYSSPENKEMAKQVRIALLKEDAVLWPHIDARENGPPPKKASEGEILLLTGATGNLGPYLLEVLCQRPRTRKVYCIIQAKSDEAGRDRLVKHLQEVKVLGRLDMGKVSVLKGNIVEERLGLDAETYDKLSVEVDCVFNSAVLANHLAEYRKVDLKYPSVRSVNVIGTQRILEFACSGGKTKWVYQGSTLLKILLSEKRLEKDMKITEDRLHGDADVIPDEFSNTSEFEDAMDAGYPLSKMVADILLEEAIKRGIPCKVFVMPKINGDSEGRQQVMKNHFFVKFLYYIVTGVMPDIQLPLQLLTVNATAEVTTRAFFNDSAPSGIYNVLNPHTAAEEEIDIFCEEFGPQLQILMKMGKAVREEGEEKAALQWQKLMSEGPLARFSKELAHIDVTKDPGAIFNHPQVKEYLREEFGYKMRLVTYDEFVEQLLSDGQDSMLYSWTEFYTRDDSLMRFANDHKYVLMDLWVKQKDNPDIWKENKMLQYVDNYKEIVEHPIISVRRDIQFVIDNCKDIFLKT